MSEPADGPVQLHMAVISDTGAVMGTGMIHRLEPWLRDGRLCLDYNRVHVMITAGGNYSHGLITAGEPGNGLPLTTVPLSGDQRGLRAGDTVTILAGSIALEFPVRALTWRELSGQ